MAYKDREKNLEYNRQWYAKNKNKALATARKSYLANKDKARTKQRKRHGLPEPTRPCPAACEICSKPQTGRALSLDHCHVTGRFCGWLCQPCNNALGQFQEDPQILTEAIKYLRFTGKQPKPGKYARLGRHER